MKVAWFEPIGGHGGNDFYNFGYCQALYSGGVEVIFYTCNETRIDENITVEFTIKKYFSNIYSGNIVGRAFRYLYGLLRTSIDILKNDIEIIHVHIYHASMLEFIVLIIFNLLNKKIICTLHDIESFAKHVNKKKTTLKNLLNLSHKIILHSNTSKKIFFNKYPTYNKAKVYQINHFDKDVVFNKPISQKVARNKLDINFDGIVFLFFGQIKEVKGVDVLLEAVYKLNKKNEKDFKVIIAGKYWKTDKDLYLKVINEFGIRDKIILRTSFIKNELVPYYFAAADAVVLPYKKIYNSGVLLRSIDYNSLIIASDLELMKEFITHNENGLLFKCNDPDSLADKMFYVLNLSKEEINRMKANLTNFNQVNYSYEIIYKQLMDVYTSK